MKTLKTRLAGTLAALLLLPVLAAAAPLLINYQGRLVDTTGNPLVGAQSILFSVYDAASGGTLLWSETQSVTPDNGIFAVSLGGVTPLPASVFSSDARYLEIKIGSDSPMSPRTRLLSTPYALYTANLGSSGTQATISTDTVMSASQLKLGNFNTLPGAIGEGAIVYDSVGKQINFWNGTAWSPLSSGGASPWSSASGLVYLGNNSNLVGVGTASPAYRLQVSSGAGETGTLMAVSTGTADIFTVNGLGEVRANKFYGDGSALTGIVTTDKVLKTGDTMTGALTMDASPAFKTTTESAILIDTNVAVNGQLKVGAYASAPDAASLGAGALYYNNSGTLYVSNGSAWNPLASGGASPWTGGGTGTVSLVAPADKVTMTSTAADALKVSGGITAGSGNVAIIDTTGKIPAISASYFANMDGSALTGVITSTAVIVTDLGTKAADSAVVHLAGDTMTGALTMNNVNLNLTGASGKIVSQSSITTSGGFFGDGSGLTGVTASAIPASNVTAGSLGANVIASSVAVGSVYDGAILTVTSSKLSGALPALDGSALTGVITSTAVIVADLGTKAADNAVVHLAGDTMTGALTLNNVNLNLTGASGKIVSQSSITTSGGFFGDGSGLTGVTASAIPASAVTAGSLGANVIASSVAVNGVYTDAIADLAVTDAKINDVAGSKITGAGTIATDLIAAGALGANVIASSIAVNGVYTDAIADLAVTDAKINDVAGSKITGAGSIASDRIAAGALGSSVITSSAAVASVYDGAIVSMSSSKLSGAIPDAQLSGTYSNALTFGSAAGGPIAIATNAVVNGQLKVGAYASAPDATALGAGAIYYKTGDTLYVSNGTSWTQLAAGGASPWTGGGTGTVSLVTPTDKVTMTNTAADALKVSGGITAGSGNVAIIDTTGKIPAISASYFASLDGSALTGVITSTAVIVADLGTKAADNAVVHLAGDTMTGALTMNNVNLNLTGASGRIVSQSSITTSGGFFGDGSGLTGVTASAIPASAVTAGSLGASVIASSVAVNGVYTDAIADLAVTDAKINDVAGSKITGAGTIATNLIAAGALGPNVIASSVAVNGVYTDAIADLAVTDAKISAVSSSKLSGAIPQAVTVFASSNCDGITPAAEGQFCYDTTLHMLSVSTSTAIGGYAAIATGALTTW